MTKSGDREHLGQHDEIPSLLKIQLARCRSLEAAADEIVPTEIKALWEAEAGGSRGQVIEIIRVDMLLRKLRQENHLNPEGRGCSELRLRHCTPAWSAVVRSRLIVTSVAGITGTHHCALLIFVFLVEAGFCHVGQSGLELLTFRIHPPQPTKVLELQVKKKKRKKMDVQENPTLNWILPCFPGWFELLGSSDPSVLASQSAVIIG
ncbi:EEF1A lysine methyltransferase 2, partial [Plecturocebus cupreus]